jgi:hypothetical protein
MMHGIILAHHTIIHFAAVLLKPVKLEEMEQMAITENPHM